MIGRKVRLHWETDNEMFIGQKSANLTVLPQNKVGMQLCDGSWYVLSEEACFLFELGLATILFDGQEVKDAVTLYKLIRENCKDSLDLLYMYKSIRKNGLFCRRANHAKIKMTLEGERGLAHLKKNSNPIKQTVIPEDATFVIYTSQADYLKDTNGAAVAMVNPASQVKLVDGKIAVVSHADYNVLNMKLMDV